jgi:hypothetical protein
MAFQTPDPENSLFARICTGLKWFLATMIGILNGTAWIAVDKTKMWTLFIIIAIALIKAAEYAILKKKPDLTSLAATSSRGKDVVEDIHG